MNERQLTVCAIALFADGFSNVQIAKALAVSKDRAQELIEQGASEQRNGTMGYMKNCPHGEHHVVSVRDDQGNILNTVKRM